MFIFKNIIFISIIFFVSNCSLNNLQRIENKNSFSVEIETPKDKYNTYFKENLKRYFHTKNNKTKSYILKTMITFESTDTLSVNGNNKLKSTKAKVEYQIMNKITNVILKSGSISSNPALSSSSTSYYTQQKSIENIKERLIKNSAKSLYMLLNMIVRNLS